MKLIRSYLAPTHALQHHPPVHLIRCDTSTDSVGQLICNRAASLNVAYVVMAKVRAVKLWHRVIIMKTMAKVMSEGSKAPLAVFVVWMLCSRDAAG